MSPETKKWIHMVAFILVIVGAVNLGLFGIIPANGRGEGFDLLQAIFGFNVNVLDTVYVLIGASAIYLLVTHRKDCKVCSK